MHTYQLQKDKNGNKIIVHCFNGVLKGVRRIEEKYDGRHVTRLNNKAWWAQKPEVIGLSVKEVIDGHFGYMSWIVENIRGINWAKETLAYFSMVKAKKNSWNVYLAK